MKFYLKKLKFFAKRNRKTRDFEKNVMYGCEIILWAILKIGDVCPPMTKLVNKKISKKIKNCMSYKFIPLFNGCSNFNNVQFENWFFYNGKECATAETRFFCLWNLCLNRRGSMFKMFRVSKWTEKLTKIRTFRNPVS